VSVLEAVVADIDRFGEEVRQMKILPPPRKRRIGFVR
jgi:hypothetical protein